MNNNIGILGLGLVGNSVLNFFKKKYPNFSIKTWDAKTDNEYSLKELYKFADKLIISPGFSIHKLLSDLDLPNYSQKMIGELDVFSDHFFKKSIGVTGSLGKTSIVTLLQNYLSLFNKSKAAGNIGTPMLDVVFEQDDLDVAILELSSFQLNLNHKFAPDIAIFNNFYPNHLDWHKDIKDYLFSKLNIFKYQNENQYSLFSSNLLSDDRFCDNLKHIRSKICVVGEYSDSVLSKTKELNLKEFYYFYKKENFFKLSTFVNNKEMQDEIVFDLTKIPHISFIENWFFVLTTFYILKLDFLKLEQIFLNSKSSEKNLQEHRLEHFASINNIDFYNDSKATVFQATQFAVKKLQQLNRPIILILGGLDKGVDRTPFFESLKSEKNIKQIYFFGNNLSGFDFIKQKSSLDDVLNDILQIAHSGDLILFSPSGTSFDFYKDYKHRGEVFKHLVWSCYGCCSKPTKK